MHPLVIPNCIYIISKPITSIFKKDTSNLTAGNNAPEITSATYDNGVVIVDGENLKDTYIAFISPAPASDQEVCREMIDPACVLQKLESTDTTIKFNSNWIGGDGTYEIYVENPTNGKSNTVNFSIPIEK